MSRERIYLETYVLQKDMRVRMPKTILANLPLTKGISRFDIYLDRDAGEVILKLRNDETPGKESGA